MMRRSNNLCGIFAAGRKSMIFLLWLTLCLLLGTSELFAAHVYVKNVPNATPQSCAQAIYFNARDEIDGNLSSAANEALGNDSTNSLEGQHNYDPGVQGHDFQLIIPEFCGEDNKSLRWRAKEAHIYAYTASTSSDGAQYSPDILYTYLSDAQGNADYKSQVVADKIDLETKHAIHPILKRLAGHVYHYKDYSTDSRVYVYWERRNKLSENFSFDITPLVTPTAKTYWLLNGETQDLTCPTATGYLCTSIKGTGVVEKAFGVYDANRATTATLNNDQDSTVTYSYKKSWSLVASTNLPSGVVANTTPAVGTTEQLAGDLELKADKEVLAAGGGTKYLLAGWSGTGSVSSSSLDNSPYSVNLQKASSINWQYDTYYRLATAFAVGTPVSVIAASGSTPENNSWLKSGNSVSPTVNLLVTDNSTGYVYRAKGWKRLKTADSTVQASGTGASATAFTLSEPTTIEWTYERVEPLEIALGSLPEALANGFTPKIGEGLAVYNAATLMSAPVYVYTSDQKKRYVLENYSYYNSATFENGTVPSNYNSATYSVTKTIKKQSSMTWNYREEFKVGVKFNVLTSESVAKATECAGINVSGTCISWSNSNPLPAGAVAASSTAPNYYPANTKIIATTKYSVTDGTAKSCTGAVLFGATPTAEGMENGRQHINFILTEPVELTWLYGDTTVMDVGAKVTNFPTDWSGEEPVVDVVLPNNLSAEDAYFFGGNFDADFPAKKSRLFFLQPITSVNVTWPKVGGTSVTKNYTVSWPTTMQKHIVDVPVKLNPAGATYTFAEVKYSAENNATVSNAVFEASAPGKSVLMFVKGSTIDTVTNEVKFVAVESRNWNDPSVSSDTGTATVGSPLSDVSHNDPELKNGYVFNLNSYYDGTGSNAAYNRDTRDGPIIPVNVPVDGETERALVVVWYMTDGQQIGWPVKPIQYSVSWPASPSILTIGTGETIAPVTYPQASVYNQPDSTLPGYNPNEEHAMLSGGMLYALRDDLNKRSAVSEPYLAPHTLLKYKDVATNSWKIKPYKVVRQAAYSYDVVAGTPLLPPLPDALAPQEGTAVTAGQEWSYTDWKGGLWAKAQHPDGPNQSQIGVNWYYPMQASFYYPDYDNDGSPDKVEGDPIPFLSPSSKGWPNGRDADSGPVSVGYKVSWPSSGIKTLSVGDTLHRSKNGLPDLANWQAGKVIYDENVYNGKGPLAKLYTPLRLFAAELTALPTEDNDSSLFSFASTETDPEGKTLLSDLPQVIKERLRYDPLNKKLIFGGIDMGNGWLLPNLMTNTELTELQSYDKTDNSDWDKAIKKIYDAVRNPQNVSLSASGDVTNPYNKLLVDVGTWNNNWGGNKLGLNIVDNDSSKPVPVAIFGENMALTAGMAQGTGYVVLTENDDLRLGGAPVALHVIKIDKPVFKGEIKVVESDNLFDEKVTLRHSGDFAGEPEKFTFQWYFQPTSGAIPSLPANGSAPAAWTQVSGASGPQITFEKSGSMSDKAVMVRYSYKNAWPAPAIATSPDPADGITNWSPWAGAPSGVESQLAEGWIKRVTQNLNLLDARVKDFTNSATNTRVSMLGQLGESCGGDIAFNSSPEYLNQIGIVAAYETVLRRGKLFTIDANPPVNDSAALNALQLATTKLAYFYSLIGNEAYADAADPTIGFSTMSGEYGTIAPSIFAFQNQSPTLLDEELTLLRGRDTTSSSTRTCPTYNRFTWNFTHGEGEVAYAQVYNISDQNDSGVIDEADAREQYPQGHGDAWGHYLTGIKYYYQLMQNGNFTWVPQSETVTVNGSPVTIDYQDERRFAQLAALKAKSGAEIVDLTYRSKYVDDPSGQWQGYQDTDSERAWGVDEWARRAGQGAYFDWVVANAMLPAEDTAHTGISKVDRTTVKELDEIAAQASAIQSKMEQVDVGLNPLGLAKGVVPFDLDPAFLVASSAVAGQTHFEQIYDRAQKALQNAVAVYDNANQFSTMLRKNQDTLEDFKDNLDASERDYLNRLIEIYGYPYADDIGPGKTYPDGYTGPDWIHYAYVDRSELTGEPIAEVKTYTTQFNFDNSLFDSKLGITAATKDVTYHIDAENHWMTKPKEWTSKRRSPGEIQEVLSELLLAQGNLQRGLKEYDELVADMEFAVEDLQLRHGILQDNIQVTDSTNGRVSQMNKVILGLNVTSTGLRRTAETVDSVAVGAAEMLPSVVGLSTDGTAPGRGAILIAASSMSSTIHASADVLDLAKQGVELDKERVNNGGQLQLQINDARYEVQQQAKELSLKVNGLTTKRIELATLKESVQQANGRYLNALSKGQRLLQERAAFRARTSADVQEYRFDDLSFRIFRNDALQKYRASFDLAARYVYLAATAYDYETNLEGSNPGSGGKFLEEIVRQRSLGQLINGTPMVGYAGLADPMARMEQNFGVYKSQLGFNSPQHEFNQFSLRKEWKRINDGTGDAWQNVLKNAWYDDLWKIPEFKRYCKPFAPESAGAQPGLVLEFATDVTYGRNFFGNELGGGDSAYDPTNLATKIRSVAIGFDDYDTSALSTTPRVYLVPVGSDMLRSASGDGMNVRAWHVVDQKIPAPFPIGASSLADPNWIPINDSLSEEMAGIRRMPSLLATSTSAADFDPSQTTSNSRLIGRSVWNDRWLLIIPARTLLFNADAAKTIFNDTVSDIKLFFTTYAYSGN